MVPSSCSTVNAGWAIGLERGEILETNPESDERKSQSENGIAGMRGRDSRRKLFFSKLLFQKELVAGRQGFELGAGPVSNMVMARDFWFQALESQAVTSLRFVHCRPPESSRFCPRRGDILESVP